MYRVDVVELIKGKVIESHFNVKDEFLRDSIVSYITLECNSVTLTKNLANNAYDLVIYYPDRYAKFSITKLKEDNKEEKQNETNSL